MKHSWTIFILLQFIIIPQLNAQSVEELGRFYMAGDYEKVVKLGKQALNEDAGNPKINLIVGRALTDKKQFKEAIPYLRKGLVNKNNEEWVRAWSLGYLGHCYFLTDQYKLSKMSLRRCVDLNETKNSVKYAQKRVKLFQMQAIFDSWDIMKTEHLRFHIQNKDRINNLENYISSREKAYKAINAFFEATPYKTIDVFIWENQDVAKKVLNRHLGFANSNLCIINAAVKQTRGHELTHILMNHGIRPKKRTRLINEGVAVYFDQTNRDRYKVARESLGNDKIDIIDLWKHPDHYPRSYNYTIGGAFIAFLMEHGGEARLKELLANQTPKAAAQIYDDFDALIAAFERRMHQ